MKRKIGELYDKPIVIGNPNEITKNEISIKALSSGSEEFKARYFNVTKVSKDMLTNVLFMASVIKINVEGKSIIYQSFLVREEDPTSFGITEVMLIEGIPRLIDSEDSSHAEFLDSNFIEMLKEACAEDGGELIEITKEEFYNS